jgi:hypothetical protein
LKYGLRPFDILFRRKLNGLKDYKETLVAMTNILAIEARARDIGEIVFPAIGARARRNAKKKYKDKNREKER